MTTFKAGFTLPALTDPAYLPPDLAATVSSAISANTAPSASRSGPIQR